MVFYAMFSLTERTLGRMSRSRCIQRMLTLIRHLVGIDKQTNAEDVVYPMNADFYINLGVFAAVHCGYV